MSNQTIYRHKITLSLISALMLFFGVLMAYLCYDNEPWETIAGFISGFGCALMIIFVSIKQPKNP